MEICGVSSKDEEEVGIDGEGKKEMESLWIERFVGWISTLMFPYLKYCFHGAIIVFYALILYRFHLGHNEDITSVYNVCAILGTIPLMFMAAWSHYVAAGHDGLDAGYLEWEHFRDS